MGIRFLKGDFSASQSYKRLNIIPALLFFFIALKFEGLNKGVGYGPPNWYHPSTCSALEHHSTWKLGAFILTPRSPWRHAHVRKGFLRSLPLGWVSPGSQPPGETPSLHSRGQLLACSAAGKLDLKMQEACPCRGHGLGHTT